MKRTPLKRKTPIKRGPWRKATRAEVSKALDVMSAFPAPTHIFRPKGLRWLPSENPKQPKPVFFWNGKNKEVCAAARKAGLRVIKTKGFKSVTRDRMLTPAEVREDEKIRRQIEKEFPPLKPRKRLKPQSDRMREKQKDYRRAKEHWWALRILADDGRCQYEKASGGRCWNKAMKEPHHMAGRIGANLSDSTKWLAVCFRHHRWIHDNVKEATERGYIIREYQKH